MSDRVCYVCSLVAVATLDVDTPQGPYIYYLCEPCLSETLKRLNLQRDVYQKHAAQGHSVRSR